MDVSLHRAVRLIHAYRERLSLDLRGTVVLTEAGTGPFRYSPLIALGAGAERVIVVAPTSGYATHDEIKRGLAEAVVAASMPSERLEVIPSRDTVGREIDIFLNLGFVRPIDAALLRHASPEAVVSYMCESWEFREGDVDLTACSAAGIPVAGVNENFGGFGVFDACGQLAIKLLFEAGVEVADCSIVTIGGDRFGQVVDKALRSNRARSLLLAGADALTREMIAGCDALVIASYAADQDLFASAGVTPRQLAAWNPTLKVVALIGAFDRGAFEEAGIKCYPSSDNSEPRRMTRTLAYLGDRPVIALHSLGMKVAQLLYSQKNANVPFGNFAELVQPLAPGKICSA